MLVLVVVAALGLVVSRPGADAIVLGDGLTLASGPGPTTEPTQRWSRELLLRDALPPLVVGETVVVVGDSGASAAAIAINRSNGRQLWANPIGAGDPVAVVRLGDDVVTVATDDDGGTVVERLRPRSGTRVWERPVTLPGTATSATALPAGRLLLRMAVPDGIGERWAVVLGDDGAQLLETGGATGVAVSATLLASVSTRSVGTAEAIDVLAYDGTSMGALVVAAGPVEAVALADDRVVVAAGQTVRALEVGTGAEAWRAEVGAPVTALVASATGVVAVTAGEHVGLDAAGRERWRDRRYPVPLLRDGHDVTALVGPEGEDAVAVSLVDDTGDVVAAARVAEGELLAVGRDHVLSSHGERVRATPYEGTGAPPWSVAVGGRPAWVVLAGPTMVVLTRDDGVLTSWS